MKFRRGYPNILFGSITKKKGKNYSRNRKLRQEGPNIRQIKNGKVTKLWSDTFIKGV